jgi:hypothetical protein
MNTTSHPPVGYSIAVDIPHGYYPLPLSGTGPTFENIATSFTESAPEEIRSGVSDAIAALGFFLEALTARQAVYCGIGRHMSDTGRRVTSWITISLLHCGEPRNPRLVLQDLAMNKLTQEPSAVVEPVDVGARPMLFSELTRRFPAPELPGIDGGTGDVPVFQLEALVPSDDGTTVAVIEFSTVSVGSGPLYSEMLFAMAASIRFIKSTSQHSSLSL